MKLRCLPSNLYQQYNDLFKLLDHPLYLVQIFVDNIKVSPIHGIPYLFGSSYPFSRLFFKVCMTPPKYLYYRLEIELTTLIRSVFTLFLR